MAALESTPLFGQLAPEDLRRVAALARPRKAGPGQLIFREGEAGDGMYLIEAGEVEICSGTGQHPRHVFARVGEGEIIGEMAVVEDRPRSASAIAVKDTALLFFPRTEFLEVIRECPALSLALLREISGRLREFNQHYLKEVINAERLAILGRFSRSIVHDLKNPLNVIGLTAELAGMSQATPQVRANASNSIRLQVERISDMISEILEFTEGPQREVLLAPMDYSAFLSRMLDEIRPEVALKSIALVCDGPLAEARVLLHPKRMRRVLCNLIFNAADAMPDGGTVFVRARVRPGEVVTEVEDTGPGLAPEVCERLFEPFVTHGKANGTGLGLSIAKRIVEDHKGWIAGRSQPGRGAVFSFGLPLVPAPAGGAP